MLVKTIVIISFLIFNFSYSQVNESVDKLKKYIKKYKPIYFCDEEEYTIPRFQNIDNVLFKKIEKDFLNEDFSYLYLLIVPVKINHIIYINEFNQDFIINDGLTCEDDSLIKLVRMAMKSKKFEQSLSTEEMETTGDILYWVSKNKLKIKNYKKIDQMIKD